ncbi:lysozyme inhibitor [Altererythrobacter sp. ZODW24]|uniref:lysozyme inhibitor n=1 Tax=Altererythrobacter sp. ZODW24 TaxID=2185142 RepID=UPI0013B3FF16|nr:lysozyme inhibitor [Altererythrobacter sp. ZODW24]
MRTLSIISAALLATAQPSGTAAPYVNPGPVSDRTVSYACANGMEIDTTFLQVAGLEAVIVTFPNGRTEKGAVRRLLPATQTGSGVRYASDITLFHMKGRNATFDTAVSAQSEAIARTTCTELGSRDREPLTQAAPAGRYLTISPLRDFSSGSPPAYRRVENFCIAKDGSGAVALMPAGHGRLAQLITMRGGVRETHMAELGAVDPGAGQRHYALMAPDTGDTIGSLHFIAPGMVAPEAVNAAASLSSVTLGSERTECLAMDNAVYAALTRSGLAVVALEEGSLSLRFNDTYGAEQTMGGGYYSGTNTAGYFYFFDGAKHVRISAQASGSEVANDILHHDELSNHLSPLAFFQADSVILSSAAPLLDADTGDFLQTLMICKHLAGESSGVKERDRQVKESWAMAGCDTLPGRYETVLQEAGSEGSLPQFLAQIGGSDLINSDPTKQIDAENSSYRITPSSVGRIEIGMTVAEARAASGLNFVRGYGDENSLVIDVKDGDKTVLVIGADEGVEIAADGSVPAIVDEAKIAGIVILDARYKTENDVHVGMTIANASKKYGKLKEMFNFPHGGETGTFVGAPEAFGFTFKARDDQTEAGIYQAVPGCSEYAHPSSCRVAVKAKPGAYISMIVVSRWPATPPTPIGE